MMEQPKHNLDGKNRRIGIHFFYVVLILGLIIVLLITQNWTKLDGFTEYLNVAATVTSLALGVLAIIYAFVSSGAINQSLGSIEHSASKMSRVADDLGGVLIESRTIQSKAEERTQALHGLVGELKAGLNSLDAVTHEIAGSVAHTRDQVSNFLKTTSSGPIGTAQEEAQKAARWGEKDIAAYIDGASSMGLLSLYACLRAYEAKKYVDFKKLLSIRDYEYAWGFLAASKAAGVVVLDHPDDMTMRAVRLKEPSDLLRKAILERWKQFTETGDKERRNFIRETIDQVKASFVDHAVSEDDD